MKKSKGKKAKYIKVLSANTVEFDKSRAKIFKVKTRFKKRETFKILIKKPEGLDELSIIRAKYYAQMKKDKLRHEFFECKHKFQPRNAFEMTAGRGSAYDPSAAHEFKAS